jgi:hypothetical protein
MTAVASGLFREQMSIIRVTETVNASGRVEKSEEVEAVRGAFRQRASIDALSDGVIVTDEVVVYLPPDAVVAVGDRLEVRGNQYEVRSTTFPQVNFRTGLSHHCEVRVRRSQR